MSTCNCQCEVHCPIPPEPAVGTTVKDRYGNIYTRYEDGWGQPGFYHTGVWGSMWKKRGPLTPMDDWSMD